MNKIKCKLKLHSKAQHLNQIYTGFIELEKRGLIDVIVDKHIDSKEHILEAVINDNIKVVYDTFDEGWKYSSSVNIGEVDFYFKRSFDPCVHPKISGNIIPLGLNYNVYSRMGNLIDYKEVIINKIKKIVKNKKKDFYVEDFEFYPQVTYNPQICFLTRLWDPNGYEVENSTVKNERIEINEFRAACIMECKKKYGSNFIGGVEDSEFSRKFFSHCIVGNTSITKRANFIDTVKKSEICIATTGLHKSVGWKFGEYVAASRAIVTEPLYYGLPGVFEDKINYLKFSTVDELISSLEMLLKDRQYRFNMMMNNYNYYNNYVRPDRLIMNTLLNSINMKLIN